MRCRALVWKSLTNIYEARYQEMASALRQADADGWLCVVLPSPDHPVWSFGAEVVRATPREISLYAEVVRTRPLEYDFTQVFTPYSRSSFLYD